MWTVVYMAPNKEIIERLQQLLEDAKIITKVRPVDRSSADDNDCSYEILVPEQETKQAHDIIINADL